MGVALWKQGRKGEKVYNTQQELEVEKKRHQRNTAKLEDYLTKLEDELREWKSYSDRADNWWNHAMRMAELTQECCPNPCIECMQTEVTMHALVPCGHRCTCA